MSEKIKFGRVCEDFVAELISLKTGYIVSNLNDIRNNHPFTDLAVSCPESDVLFEISIKAKKSPNWPAVKGISSDNQYLVFVDIYECESPSFYILNNQQWQKVLKKILPKRENGAEIINGALEWNWIEDGKAKRFRGSRLLPTDIAEFKDNWKVIPGISR